MSSREREVKTPSFSRFDGKIATFITEEIHQLFRNYDTDSRGNLRNRTLIGAIMVAVLPIIVLLIRVSLR